MVSALVPLDPGVFVPVPSLSAQQRADALGRAVAARRERAALKGRLKQGEVTIAAVLAAAEHDPVTAQLRVRDLLASMPGVGEATATRLMHELRIAPSRRVGGLGPRQCRALVEWFECR